MRQCFQLIGAGHNKFWTVEVVGKHYLATFGKIGTHGQTQVKTFGTAREAMDKADAMIDEKTRKGYRRVGNDAHPGAQRALLTSLAEAPAPATATMPKPMPAEQPGPPASTAMRRIVPMRQAP
jgi:predicted DNA-binding WGR domain protein